MFITNLPNSRILTTTMKRNLLLSIGVLSVVLIFFVSAKKTQSAPTNIRYEIGDKAVDFKLKNVDGKMVSMEDYPEAKGFIVVFTCNTCPFSKMYEERIIALDKQFKDKGYPVIAINPNDKKVQPGDSFDAMVERSAEKGYTFPYLYDETQEIATAYGATRTPHVYVLNKNNSSLNVAYIGAIDNNHKDAAQADKRYVEDVVNDLLKGNNVSVNSTKAIGCTIKWKAS